MLRNLKVLGLTLLALVGMTAVSSSVAQAAYQLLEDGQAVDSVTVDVTVLPGEILVPKLELAIYCEGGTGSATLEKEGSGVVGLATAEFEECEMLDNPFCEVEFSPAHVEGHLLMEGDEYFVLAMDEEEFTTIFMSGAFCSLPEESPIHGSLILKFLEPLEDLVAHLAHLQDHGLFFGAHEMTIDGPSELGVLVHATNVSGLTYSVHLVEL
jgi:hypothetical protein